MTKGEFKSLIPYNPIRPSLEKFLEINRYFYEFLIDEHWNGPNALGKILSPFWVGFNHVWSFGVDNPVRNLRSVVWMELNSMLVWTS